MERPIKQHIDFLDPIRGIAILFVFIFHSLSVAYGKDSLPWGSWFREFTVTRSFLALLPASFGWAGVALFFVISGFCIHLSFSRQPHWPAFFHRRFFRLYPPYLAALLFFAFIYPISRVHFHSLVDTAQIVSHITLLHNFDHLTSFAINASFWSIAVEIQLYALYPLLIWLIARFGWSRTLLGIAAIEVALRLADGVVLTARGNTGLPRWIDGSPFFYWFSWSMGAYVAERHIRNNNFSPPGIFLYAIAAMAVASNFVKPLSGLSFLFFALLTAGVIGRILGQTDQQLPIPDALNKYLQQVGIWSFSLYLLHQPLLAAVPHLAAALTSGAYIHPAIIFMACLASWFFIVPIARLSYQYCELPSIALGKLLRPARPVPSACKKVTAVQDKRF